MPDPHKNLRKAFKYVFLIAGVGLFFGLVHKVGWGQILQELQTVGWGMIPFIGIHALKEALTTSAWRVAFPKLGECSWYRLYLINWMSSAVNKIYHAGILGGEITKVAMLHKDVCAQGRVASVLIAKLAEAVARAVFILSGLYFILRVLRLAPGWERGILISYVFLTGSIVAFWILQRKGMVRAIIYVLGKVRILPVSWLNALRRKSEVLDQSMSQYHRDRPGAFRWAVALHLLRCGLTMIQIQLVLWLLGVPVGFLRCFIISAFSLLVNALFFFIPGRLGAQEGGKVIIARALGMTVTQGLTLGIVSRLNQMIWSSLGLAVFFFWQRRVPQAEPAGDRIIEGA